MNLLEQNKRIIFVINDFKNNKKSEIEKINHNSKKIL